MKKSIVLLVLILMVFSEGYSKTNVKTMFYNLLYCPSGDPQNRGDILKDIVMIDPSCTVTYTQFLRDNLYLMSDHLPVVMELFTPQNILNVEDYTINYLFKILGSNRIQNNVSILINENLYNPKLKIYYHLGQIIKVVKTSTNNEINIDTNNLSAGLYVIRPENNKITNPLKFIKTN